MTKKKKKTKALSLDDKNIELIERRLENKFQRKLIAFFFGTLTILSFIGLAYLNYLVKNKVREATQSEIQKFNKISDSTITYYNAQFELTKRYSLIILERQRLLSKLDQVARTVESGTPPFYVECPGSGCDSYFSDDIKLNNLSSYLLGNYKSLIILNNPKKRICSKFEIEESYLEDIWFDSRHAFKEGYALSNFIAIIHDISLMNLIIQEFEKNMSATIKKDSNSIVEKEIALIKKEVLMHVDSIYISDIDSITSIKTIYKNNY